MTHLATANRADPLGDALRACRAPVAVALLFGTAVNVLYLATPLYMLQVDGRALPARSVATLVALSLALAVALLAMAAIDGIRARLLARIGARLDARLAVQAARAAALSGCDVNVADVDRLRQLCAGPGLPALLDLPWAPVFAIILFLVDPALGATAAVGVGVMLVVAGIGAAAIRRFDGLPPMQARAQRLGTSIVRHAEVVRTMGLERGLLHRLSRARADALRLQTHAAERTGVAAATRRGVRVAVQAAILGVGAKLAIADQITPPAALAATLLAGRMLQPVEQAVASWRQYAAALAGLHRLRALFAAAPAKRLRTSFAAPAGDLEVKRLVVNAHRGSGGGSRAVLRSISLRIPAGSRVGIIGRSGAGKSTLARCLVGAVIPQGGVVRLDGADLRLRDPAELGRHIGWLPQEVRLFAGNVRDNIARFGDADDGEVGCAAQAVGAHAMILSLPDGYETEVGEDGALLSAGQLQRVGLARAMLGTPRVVVLDEPNASLDAEGEVALRECLARLAEKAVTTIVVAHRPSFAGSLDTLVVLQDGSVERVGPRTTIMDALRRQALRPVGPSEEVSA